MIFVKINRDDLIEALTMNVDSLGGDWFLDTETGAVLLNSDAIDDLPEDMEGNPRYLAIYPIPSHESFQIMEDFVANLGDTKDNRRLADATFNPAYSLYD